MSHIGPLVVDEAHCISDWGHDFRPDYRRIAHLVRDLPDHVPVLATTATANDRVVADVREALGAEQLQIIRGPLARESLCLQTIVLPAQSQRYAWISEHVPELPGSGIVYTLTIHDAQSLAAWLQHEGIDAYAYWGALDDEERRGLEADLLANRIKVLVSTSARDRRRIEALARTREREQQRMSEYMAGETCLMQFLEREMDDRSGRRCGRCAVCVGRPLIDPTYDRETAQRAHMYLLEIDKPIEPRKRWPEFAFSRYP